MELRIISPTDLTPHPHTGRPVTALDRLDATLAYARAADELGLDVFTLGEHHSHKLAVLSPAVVLAVIAGQTERIGRARAVRPSGADAVRQRGVLRVLVDRGSAFLGEDAIDIEDDLSDRAGECER